MQTLRWSNVKWTDEDAATAAYHCEACGAAWSDGERWAAVRLGEWRAGAPFKGVAGFHISELYSPWRRLAETVGDYFEAQKGGVEERKAWKNTALGEEWEDAGEVPDWERLVERREVIPLGLVPRRAVVLTAGIDNQASPERLEIAVWAWGPGYESWLVYTAQIMGSPSDDAPWNEVAALVAKDWPREGGGSMRIGKLGADTGGQHTQGVYAQLRRLREPRIMPVKGVSGWNKVSPVTGPTPVDITAAGKKIKQGLRLWTVSVDVFKAEFYRQLWLSLLDEGGFPPGWVHLPDGISVEEVKQLVAEQLVSVKNRMGFARLEWQPVRPRNEQLDMRVYARAALSVLGSDRYGERFWAEAAKAYVVEPPPPEPPVTTVEGVEPPPTKPVARETPQQALVKSIIKRLA